MEHNLQSIEQYLRSTQRCTGSSEGQLISDIWSFNVDGSALSSYKAELLDLGSPRYFAKRDILGFSNPSRLLIDVVSSKDPYFDTLKVLEYHLALRVADKYNLDVEKVSRNEVRFVSVVTVPRDLKVMLDALDEFSRNGRAVLGIHDTMFKDAKVVLDALVSLPK